MDWLLVEIVPTSAGNITIHQEETYPLEAPLRRCMAVQLPEFIFVTTGIPGKVRVVASPLQREPYVNQTANGGSFNFVLDIDDIELSDATTHLLLVYNDAAAWKEAGADFVFRFAASVAFSWRIAASGSMTCMTGPHEFGEGELVQTPAVTRATDLREPFALVQSGHGWASVDADVEYDYSVDGPAGVVVSRTSVAGNPDAQLDFLYELPAGPYDFSIRSMTGQATAQTELLALDMPPWATGVLADETIFRAN